MKATVDGDAICITKDNFVNLRESEAVFVTVYSEDNIDEIAALLNRLFAENAADQKMAEAAVELEHVMERRYVSTLCGKASEIPSGEIK